MIGNPAGWLFEPTSPEGASSGEGPWEHAVKGIRPQRPSVFGYGHTEIAADTDARRKAQQQDAREVLGERGEVVTALRISIRRLDIHTTMLTVYDDTTGGAIIQGQLVATDFYAPPMPFVLSSGSASWNTIDTWPGFDMMPMGT